MNYEISLLIADDEPNIRRGLQVGIDWKRLGIQNVYVAKNGSEAYRLCQEHRIQIVLTDIRMPEINGLELGHRLTYRPLKIIIMSGYAEFEYAKSAIELGVIGYLLKPVDISSLESLVKKAVSEIQVELDSGTLPGTAKNAGLELHQIIFCNDENLSIAKNTFSNTILRTFSYVNDHYSEPLQIKDAAQHIEMSNNYFSTVFKKETSTKFNDYLNMMQGAGDTCDGLAINPSGNNLVLSKDMILNMVTTK